MVLMTEHTARSSIVIGIIELVFGAIAVICGIVSVSLSSVLVGSTIGLWAFYFAIPGILSILTGVKKNPRMMRGALAANIVGVILALGAFVNGAIIWSYIHVCGYCSRVTPAVTIVYLLLGTACFIGSIYGFSVCFCPSNAPTVTVTSTGPQTNTIVISNQTSQEQPMANVQGQPMTYPQGQPIASGQGQTMASGQGQPMASGQGQPMAYGQGQPMAYGQGQPMAYGQGQPMAYGQGQPMAYGQGQPMAYGQGQPMAYGQGQPMAYGEAAYPGTAQQQPPAYSDGQSNAGAQYVEKQ